MLLTHAAWGCSASKGQEGQAETKESSGVKSLQVRLTHPRDNPGANKWFLQITQLPFNCYLPEIASVGV
jgi:hypothetical protein